MFVFKFKEQPNDTSNLNLDDEYIGEYMSQLDGSLVVKIFGSTSSNFGVPLQVPTYKVEKLYTWK